MTLKTVEVIAPGNLPEGYIFDATVDDITFSVTVPAGGVEEGQPIRVAYPVAAAAAAPVLVAAVPIPEESVASFVQPDGTRITETKHSDGTSTIVRETLRRNDGGGEYQPLAPTGKFRNGMCDCCEVFCSGRFWMALCCIGCYMGQIMQRFKLNAFGARGHYKNTCMICFIAFTILLVASLVLTYTVNYNLRIVITIWMTIAITLTHMEYRKKYMIPPKCCGNTCWGDCCCAFWCGCCLAIQMDRHTHDERVYKYQCCTSTGLSTGAPEIV